MSDNQYLIRFNHLPEGEHEYEFSIEDNFFAKIEESIIKQASVDVKVVLRKDSGAISLDLKIIGDVAVECVRCLEPFRFPVDIEKSLLVKVVDALNEEYEDEDEIYITSKAVDINLEHTLYDFLTLEVPYSPVHPEDDNGVETCNPKVLKHIKKKEEEKAEKEQDPRWQALKKIKSN